MDLHNYVGIWAGHCTLPRQHHPTLVVQWTYILCRYMGRTRYLTQVASHSLTLVGPWTYILCRYMSRTRYLTQVASFTLIGPWTCILCGYMDRTRYLTQVASHSLTLVGPWTFIHAGIWVVHGSATLVTAVALPTSAGPKLPRQGINP